MCSPPCGSSKRLMRKMHLDQARVLYPGRKQVCDQRSYRGEKKREEGKKMGALVFTYMLTEVLFITASKL